MRLLLQTGNAKVLLALLGNPDFQEREALILLARKDLSSSIIEEFAGGQLLINSYAVKLALARNPQTPLRIALNNLKFLYLFDLVSISLLPALHSGVKRAAEELILSQISKLTAGQRITLAKRGSARIAASLLIGGNLQAIRAVLDNPYLTESALLRVLSGPGASETVVDAIACHEKWSLRYDIRLALLRQPSVNTTRALHLVHGLRNADLTQLSTDPAVQPELRYYLAHLVGLSVSGKESP
jgi:hypothetical protein